MFPGMFCADPFSSSGWNGAIMEGLINVKDYAWNVYANTSQMSVGAGWPCL